MDKTMNIAKKLRNRLPRDVIRLLGLIDEISRQNVCSAFLVGGFVRDLLMGVKNLDLDVAVEGDAIKAANLVAAKKGGFSVSHKRFGTATLILPNGLKVDFATARKERYLMPAMLPVVRYGTIREDLYRRDFTINAMAVDISHKNFGRLIDFFGGQNDLLNKRIRVLHEASFIDDPTRILRAVRFEQRFNFRIEPHTENLIKEAIEKKMLDKTGRQRLKNELILILKEENPQKALKRVERLCGLKFIHPKLHFTKRTKGDFDSVRGVILWFKLVCAKKGAPDVWLMYLMALLDGLSTKGVERVCAEFVFKKGEQARLFSYKREGPKILRLLSKRGPLSPSQIYKFLSPLSYEVLLAIMGKSRSGPARERISDFIAKYSDVRLRINGDDLEALGIEPGPAFKKILTAALFAKLDKGFKDKAGEIAFVKKFYGL